MKRKSIRLAILGAVAAVAIVGANVAPSWAYFTANSQADGSKVINVVPKTDIDEDWDNNTKSVVIKNKQDSKIPVFVRAMVFANAKYLAGQPSGKYWKLGSDGYWYYEKTIDPGAQTEPLLVKVEWPIFDDEGEEIDHTGENFNIIVVYEATPEQYKNGKLVDPMSSDCNWDLKATTD